jgi:hypothetical protein
MIAALMRLLVVRGAIGEALPSPSGETARNGHFTAPAVYCD